MKSRFYNLQRFSFGLMQMFFLLVFINVSAQDVTGKVVGESGEGLIGASVIVKGTSKGTITDFDGIFSLPNVETGTVLVFSYTGYQQQEMSAAADMLITLSGSETLDEIVVTGVFDAFLMRALP